MKRKIGILGGTFNPVHNGHIQMGLAALEQYDLDMVWFMPNYIPPHKELDTSNVTTADRIRMLELSLKEYPKMEVCLFEIERAETSYTYKTMELLSAANPDTEFYFIIGADSLFQFDHWVHPERIVRCCSLLVAKREDEQLMNFDTKIEELIEKFDAKIYPLSMQLVVISSTEIREHLRRGEDVTGEIPLAAAAYIKENSLYVI